MALNKQAEELNKIIKKDNPTIYNLLSEKGKKIYFPKEGILAQATEAKGKEINATIGIGLDDDKNPIRLDSIAEKIDLDPRCVFPYASSYGKKELREIWLDITRKKNPSLNTKTSLPVVTNGLTNALSVAGFIFLNTGDRIITPNNFWGNYKLIFENVHEAILDTFQMFKYGEFNVNGLRDKLKGDGKKIILLNFPNNPTGYTPTKKEADEIIKIIKNTAKKNKILVICDDAYFGLTYNDCFKESLFSKLADLDKNVLAIKVDGASKECYTWGLRVGFLTYSTKGITGNVCNALEDKTAGTVRGTISNVSHLSQSLILEALKSKAYEKEKKNKYKLLKSRFDKVQKILKKYPKLKSLPCNSGYFICFKVNNAEDVRKKLLENNIGVIATGDLIRIAFSSVPEKDLEKLFENIHNLSG